MMTELLREAIGLPAINGGLAAGSLNGSGNTGTIDMSKFHRGGFLVSSSGTGNVYLKQSANANGASATNLAGGTAAMNANSFTTVETRADQMTARYLLCQIVTDAAASVSAAGIGIEPRHGPANAADNTFVVTRGVVNI